MLYRGSTDLRAHGVLRPHLVLKKGIFGTSIVPGSKEWFAVPGSLWKPHKWKEREILLRHIYSKKSRKCFYHEKFWYWKNSLKKTLKKKTLKKISKKSRHFSMNIFIFVFEKCRFFSRKMLTFFWKRFLKNIFQHQKC